MLDKLKQLGQLKALQDQAKSERFEGSREGVKVIINGNMSVEEVILNPELPVDRQAELVKECMNDAMKNAQMGMAQKLQGMDLGV